MITLALDFSLDPVQFYQKAGGLLLQILHGGFSLDLMREWRTLFSWQSLGAVSVYTVPVLLDISRNMIFKFFRVSSYQIYVCLRQWFV